MLDGHTLIKADRSTLFLHDEKHEELWSRLATGMQVCQVACSFRNHGAASATAVVCPMAPSSPFRTVPLYFRSVYALKRP